MLKQTQAIGSDSQILIQERKMKRLAMALLVLAIVLCLVAAGCGKKNPGAETTTTETTTAIPETVTEADLGVPVYTGATIEGSVEKAATETGTTVSASFTTPDALDKVAEFYKAEGEKAGNYSGSTSGSTGSFEIKNDAGAISITLESVDETSTSIKIVRTVSN